MRQRDNEFEQIHYTLRSDGAEALSDPPANLEAADAFELGGYRLRRIIGEGSFGIVYLADDPRRDRQVAIKVARPQVNQDEARRRRFVEELRLAERLDHPGIVRALELGEDRGHLFLAIEYCEGPTLASWLSSQTDYPPLDIIADLIASVADAVDAAHRCGVIHRDLKPENIVVVTNPDGQPSHARVLDFGLASITDDAMRHTRSSLLIGTPLYMAPEQLDGGVGSVTAASDIYALGAILYECLTGQSPIADEGLPKMIDRLRDGDFQSPRRLRPSLPSSIEAVCLQCLNAEPSKRYASAKALAEDLRSFRDGRPISAKLPSRFSRLQWLLRQPRHIREIGLALIIINGLVLAWCLINYPLAMLVLPQGEAEYQSEQAFWPVVAMISPVHSALLWLSVRTYRLKQTRRGAGVHFATAALMGVVAAGFICLSPQAAELPQFERVGALGLISSFAEVQSLLVLALLLAGAMRSTAPDSKS